MNLKITSFSFSPFPSPKNDTDRYQIVYLMGDSESGDSWGLEDFEGALLRSFRVVKPFTASAIEIATYLRETGCPSLSPEDIRLLSRALSLLAS